MFHPAEENLSTHRIWLLALAALSLALTVPLAYLLNIRFDEAYTLNTTANGVGEAVERAIGFGQQAPLYFVLISLWREIDPSVFFARLFSVACLPLFIWVAYEVAKRYLKDVNPLLVAIVVAVHQQVVWNALDIRLYALMMLLSGLLFLFFYDGYLADQPSRGARVLYVITAVLSLYTQYYLGFQLAAGAAVLIATRRWRPLVNYLIDMAIAGLAFIPMLLEIRSQLAGVSAQVDESISVGEMIKAIYQNVVALTLPVEWVPVDAVKRWGVRLVIVAVGVLFVAKVVRERRKEDIALGLFVVVLGGFFLVALGLAGWTVTQPRHMSGMILPLVILPFAAVAVFRSRKAVIGWTIFIVMLSVADLVASYRPLAKPGDFERVATHLMAKEAERQPIFVFHADAVLPLRQYYKGVNQLVALPQENDLDKWDPRNNVLKDEQQVLDRINSVPGPPERFWLVHDGWCAQGSLSFNCDILERVVAEHFEVESSRKFLDPTTVRLLRRK